MSIKDISNLTKYDLLFESRLTKVETTIDHVNESLKDLKHDVKEIRSDFRWLFGLMILFAGSLLGLLAKGFHWY